MRFRHTVVAVIAAFAIVIALWQLLAATAGVTVTRTYTDDAIPVTVFQPAASPTVPAAVVIAHGFAGSRQLMQPFAVTLARNGYLAVTFDFPGHGENANTLPGGLTEHEARNQALLAALDRIVQLARERVGSDIPLALIGHSMGAGVVLRYAQNHPQIAATVAVSPYAEEDIVANPPRNLLLVYGALEPQPLLDQGYAMLANAPGSLDNPQASRTYGTFADGTAQRLVLAGGVEHIGVLYSSDSLAATLDWLNQAFGRQSAAARFIDARGPWLGLLYLGLLILAWALAPLLPRCASAPLGFGHRWRPLLLVAGVPALLTPLLLWPLPTDWLPILIGDYVALHFGLYGVLTGLGLWWLNRGTANTANPATWAMGKLLLALVLVYGFYFLAFILPTDTFVTDFIPGTERLALVIALLAGSLPWFISDEWLTRGATHPRGAYAATKILFLLSLMIAVALNLAELFFLIIIIPAIVVFFITFGLLSGWVYRYTQTPLIGALANALVFATSIAAVFPVVDA